MFRLTFVIVCTLISLQQETSGHAWQLPEKEDYRYHPCMRDCLQSAGPMTCQYNFTAEDYQTLSHACYGCPGNGTDCDRPHCVLGDGVKRPVKVVNRQMPGPAIHVCQGDTVVVNVYNELDDFEGTSIHWHGVLQHGTPHMDGAAMVTQCPIPAHTMFQYKFKADNAGTHYWHAHTGHQRSDGMNGAFVVRDTANTTVMQAYDHDLTDHTIVVQDWLEDLTSVIYAMHHHGTRADLPRSILINGRGNTADAPGITIPDHIYRVSKGKRYRFRIVSNGVANCPLKLSVDGHNITLVSSDGNDIDPVDVDAFYIVGGERFDFVLNADQDVDNYWLYVVTNCEGRLLVQTAIVRYDGASDVPPTSGTTFQAGDRQGLVVNPVELGPNSTSSIMVSELTSDLVADPITTEDVKKFYIGMEFNDIETDMFLHPVHYPLSLFRDASGEDDENHLFALQMNKISHVVPWSPVLTQYDQFSEADFCNATSVQHDCSTILCRCIHRIKVNLNDVVEFVLVSGGKGGLGNHPMHLHGLNYRVIGMGKLQTTITREEVEAMDTGSPLPRNLNNPITKDTVMVPDGGYTIIRFKADNPGVWMFHCHVDFHLKLRLALLLQVGERHEMPLPPRNFPKCGHYSYVESSDPEPDTPVCSTATLTQCTHVIAVLVPLVFYLVHHILRN